MRWPIWLRRPLHRACVDRRRYPPYNHRLVDICRRVALAWFAGIIVMMAAVNGVWADETAGAPVVTAVHIVGNRTISSAAIVAKLRTRESQPFSRDIANEDIKRIYAMGYFADVVIDIEETAASVEVTFRVQEKAALKAILFEGQKHFRPERLQKLVKSQVGEFLNQRQIRDDVQAIEAFYRSKGYASCHVKHDVQIDSESNEAKVFLLIDEGPRSKIRKIRIEGNQSFKRKRLLKLMRTRTSGWFRSGILNEETLEEDAERIKAFYQREGFADVQVEPVTGADPSGRWIEVTMRIAEGTRYKVGIVTLAGTTVFTPEAVRQRMEMLEGAYFSQEALRQDIANVQEFYFEKGYIAARATPQTAVIQEQGLINVTYTLQENELAYVNKVRITGNLKTKDVVIRREMRLHPGERFDGIQLKKSKERLYNLGYFEEVTFDTVPTGEPNQRDLVVDVKEAKTGEFSFGGGFSSVDRVVGFVEVAQRNFDLLNWPTFTGGGQDLRLRGQFGSVRRDYELSFTEPWIFGRPYIFGLDVYNRTHLRSGSSGFAYDEERQGGDLRIGKEFTDQFRGDIVYRLESVDISDVPSNASADFRAESGENAISSLLFGLTYDTRDNRFNPTRGLVLGGTVENAGGFLGQDKDFYKVTTSNAWYQTQWEKLLLELRLRAGWADAFDNTPRVPIYERFFLGGTNSVRGYEERDIGPRDRSGDTIGGNAMAVANVEYTFPVIENLKGALFYDVGNVWAGTSDFASGTWRSGAGAGVRVKTPIGPVRLDFGYPINPDDHQESNGRFHFSLTRGF